MKSRGMRGPRRSGHCVQTPNPRASSGAVQEWSREGATDPWSGAPCGAEPGHTRQPKCVRLCPSDAVSSSMNPDGCVIMAGFRMVLLVPTAVLALAGCESPLSPSRLAGTDVLMPTGTGSLPVTLYDHEWSSVSIVADTIRLTRSRGGEHVRVAGMHRKLLGQLGYHGGVATEPPVSDPWPADRGQLPLPRAGQPPSTSP
jgi:hypothetical protein